MLSMRNTYLRFGLLLTLIVGAHLALWRDQSIPYEAKLQLTAINAAVWAVILLPAVGVGLWMRAHRRRTPPER